MSYRSIKDNDHNYLIVEGENFIIEFNKHNGYLSRYEADGIQLLNPGAQLTPNFWRAPNDNDYGNSTPKRLTGMETIKQKLPHNGCQP